MANPAIFLQSSIFTSIFLPFLLVFFIVFAILQKTKVLGDKAQLDAFVSFIIGLIIVTAFNYSAVINNLVLFLSISLVIVFVILVIWGFLSGEEGFKLSEHKGFRTVLLVIFAVAILLGVLWAFGISAGSVTSLLFGQVWSEPFWTNLIFVILIGAALAIVLGMGGKKH
ncbi:MAG: hypothetical protein WAU65_01190 [Candidatus Nanoarchaeia archaeon]